MLYYLFNYLDQHNFPGAGVFNYVTFRAAVAIILALIISVWFGNWFIKMLKRKKIVETQRDEATDPYNTTKKGDIILLAGKGHENYQEINGVKNHFDDKEALSEAFKEAR